VKLADISGTKRRHI